MKQAGVILAQFILPALVAVAIMTAGERIIGTDPVTTPIKPTAFVWADRVFSSKGAFDRWLRSRGSTYAEWATRHPTTSAMVERRSVAQLPNDVEAVAPVTRANMLFLTLGVGGFVALALALALGLRHVRIAVLRPLPTLALFGRGGSPVSAGPAVMLDRPKVRRERTPIHTRAAAWARAQNAGGSLPRRSRVRYWLFRMHYRHPELAWYAVALTFAAAVGLLVPLLGR